MSTDKYIKVLNYCYVRLNIQFQYFVHLYTDYLNSTRFKLMNSMTFCLLWLLNLITFKFQLIVTFTFTVYLTHVWDFLHLIDSFNLTQLVMSPTHIHGHTLNLILTSGIPVPNVQINEVSLSDHWPIMFSTSRPSQTPKPSLPGNYSRSITPLTARQFSDAFSSH